MQGTLNHQTVRWKLTGYDLKSPSDLKGLLSHHASQNYKSEEAAHIPYSSSLCAHSVVPKPQAPFTVYTQDH